MKTNKTFLTYASVFLFFFILVLFTIITQTDELANLVGTIIGVFITYMIFDFIFVRLFKVSEIKAVLFSFALVLIFFIITAISSSSQNAISQLLIQIIISVLLLILFIQFAKKDDAEKERLMELPYDSNINLSELSIISNISESKLKYLINRGILSQIQSETNEILFNKGKVLSELNKNNEK